MGAGRAALGRDGRAPRARARRGPGRGQGGRRLSQRSSPGARRLADADAGPPRSRRRGHRSRARSGSHASPGWRSRRLLLGAGVRRMSTVPRRPARAVRSSREDHLPQPPAFGRDTAARAGNGRAALPQHRLLRRPRRCRGGRRDPGSARRAVRVARGAGMRGRHGRRRGRQRGARASRRDRGGRRRGRRGFERRAGSGDRGSRAHHRDRSTAGAARARRRPSAPPTACRRATARQPRFAS